MDDCSKGKKPDFKKSYKVPFVLKIPNSKSIETESRLVVVRGYKEGGMGSDFFMGFGYHFGMTNMFATR